MKNSHVQVHYARQPDTLCRSYLVTQVPHTRSASSHVIVSALRGEEVCDNEGVKVSNRYSPSEDSMTKTALERQLTYSTLLITVGPHSWAGQVTSLLRNCQENSMSSEILANDELMDELREMEVNGV